MREFNTLFTAVWLVLLAAAFTGSSAAQQTGKISISGQIRHRTEYTAKDFNADRDNVWFHLLRTRVNVSAAPTEDVTAFIQVQDSRVFGSEVHTLFDGSADALDAHQAYLQVNNLFDSDFSARIGRQEIAIGNERLVGPVGWHNIGRSFDGAVISYKAETGSFKALAAKLVGEVTTPASQNLFGVIGSYPFSAGQKLEALVLLDNNSAMILGGPDNGERKLSRITLGAAATGKKSKLDYEAEAYLQTGDASAGDGVARSSISAYLLSGKLGYVVSPERNVRVGGLYTIVSGDDDATDDEFGNFSTLFATNHKFYGFMDYFLGFGGPHGLRDASLSVGFDASDRLRVLVDLHQFTADQEQATGGKTFGQEVDVTGIYSYNSAFSFRVGLSAFTPDELMESMKGSGDTAFWGYLMTIVNF